MRKIRIVASLAFGLSALSVAPARAQAPDIAHDAVSCIVVGKYPKLKACFTPGAQVAKARVYFRREDRPVWYHVEMASEEACFVGILPRPKRELLGKKVPYYVEVATQKLDVGRTQEHGPEVVRSEGECKVKAVAPYLSQATVKVFPDMPSGFTAGSSLGIRKIAGGAAAIGLGVGLLAAGGGDNPANTSPTPGPATPPVPPVPPTPPTPTPPPATNAPPSGVFAVSPDPPAGLSPMTVRFNLCRSTDPDNDPLVFRYDFGDGQRARGTCREEHVYEAPANDASGAQARQQRVADVVYHAQACVGDGRPDHDQCRTFEVRVQSEPAPPGSFALTVALAGTGTGRVTSDTGGIDCPGGTCTASYTSGAAVTLTAVASPGSTFGGWSVAACGAAPTCTVTITSAQTVTATFNPVLRFPLTVNLAGSGTGRVTSDTGGIDCPGVTCTATYPSGTPVILTAAASPGSTFAGWSVAACGTAPTCTVTVTAPQTTVTATFNSAGFPLTVGLQGTGAGRVTSNTGGIDCPRTTCTATYPSGTSVTLSAFASAGSIFVDWGGACAVEAPGGAGVPTCTVVMTSARSVTATFDQAPVLRRITVLRTGNGLVESDVQPGIVCGTACSYPAFPQGSTVVLRATPDPGWTFDGWGGDACVGATGPCTLVMTQDYTINANFGSAGRPADGSAAVSWISDLRVPRGRGQVVVDQRAWEVGSGQQRTTMEAASGERRVEATLTQAAGAGLWRFELADGLIEPGTLRVIEGKVEALMANAVVFRLTGKAGERVVFVYRLAKR